MRAGGREGFNVVKKVENSLKGKLILENRSETLGYIVYSFY